MLFAESFKSTRSTEAAMPNIADNYFIKIDGYPFDARMQNNYNVHLSSDAKTANLSFIGNDVRDKKGNHNAQRIDVQYAFNGSTGEVVADKVVFEFNKQKFYNIAGNTKVNVTKMEWSADKKSFVMSAEFTCRVKKSSVTDDILPELNIVGKIDNVTVEVPADGVKTVTE